MNSIQEITHPVFQGDGLTGKSEGRFGDPIFRCGLIMVLLSFSIHLLMLYSGRRTSDIPETEFFFCFLIAVVYWLILIFFAIFRRKQTNFYQVFPGLVLGLISCYSLNTSLMVFPASPGWFYGLLVLISIAFLLVPFAGKIPEILYHCLCFIVGAGWIVFLYLAICLLPLYPHSLILFWVLGLTLHTFVPLFFVIFIGIWFIRAVRKNRKTGYFVSGGSLTVLLAICIYTLAWSETLSEINNLHQKASQKEVSGLPQWVYIAQHIPENDLTEKILKTDLQYIIPPKNDPDWFNSSILWSDRQEERIHHPLVVIASFFSPPLTLNNGDKTDILKCNHRGRHFEPEHLWNGSGIRTTHVETSVDIWPQYRIAYTEQTFTIYNSSRGPGEAVYSFYIPEGSVVTSLSLWISGKE